MLLSLSLLNETVKNKQPGDLGENICLINMIHGTAQSIISHLKKGNRIQYENRSVTSSETLFPQGRCAERHACLFLFLRHT